MDNELMHYGVKGMRWGVRRYQNTDGTLTSTGRFRKAKMAARLGERQKLRSKQMELLKKVRMNRRAKGKSTDGIDAMIKSTKTAVGNEKRYLNKTLKELTSEEIDRGKQYVIAARTASLLIPIPASAPLYEIGSQIALERYMKE